MEEQATSPLSGSPSSDDVQALIDEGRFSYRQAEYREALSYLQQAYEECQANGDQGRMAEVANDMGVVYTVLGQWKEAEQWLDQANTLFVRLQDYDGQAQALGNLGSMFRARGDLRQAAANLQLAADRFHLVGDDERRSMTLKALSAIRLRQLRFLLALVAYNAALACQPNLTVFDKLLRSLISLPIRMLQG
jgi:tetratricopeptide (TPR) repeat protein